MRLFVDPFIVCIYAVKIKDIKPLGSTHIMNNLVEFHKLL